MHKWAVSIFLLVPVVIAGCGGGSKKTETTASGCEKVSQPAPKNVTLKKPTLKLDPSKTYTATVATTCGDFQMELDVKQAPKTAASFDYLVGKGFYNGLSFHRIVPDFVIQGGDPLGNGSGGPGYKVVEAPPANTIYAPGVVAMAKGGSEPAGTSGSQFFVVDGSQGSQLTPDYALLGNVTKGMEVVNQIGAAATSADDSPVEPIVIKKITIAVK